MEYKYDIIRSHRKSISVSISPENKIVVRCPWSMPASKIIDFLNSKEAWIDKVVNKNALRLASNDDVIEFRSIYFNGKKLPLVISDENRITPSAVYIKKVTDIGKLYKEHCSAEFIKAVNALSELTMLKPASISVKGYKGRWGCCDSKNNLIFNYMLFMLPPDVQRYVIIHELCHVLCHNHSAAFWKLVSDYQPDYRILKKKLSAFDFLTSIYSVQT